MKSKKETCKNCEQQFKEGFKFCPYCGQQSKDELTVKVLFYNTISNYFSFDARFFKSFFPLLFRPGYLAGKFIEGKRLLYLHPAQMYLFISVVFFFLYSFSARKHKNAFDKAAKGNISNVIINDSSRVNQTFDSISAKNIIIPLKDKNVISEADFKDLVKLDSLVKSETNTEGNETFLFNFKKIDSFIKIEAPKEVIYKAMGMSDDPNYFEKKFYPSVLKLYKNRDPGSIYLAAIDTIPIALFIILPLFALLLKIFFYKRGRFAHHLVFSFYLFSFLFTVFSAILAINFVWKVPLSIIVIISFSTFFYLLIGIKRFYRRGWFVSFIKTAFITFIYFHFILLPAIVGIIAFSFLNY